MTETEGMALVKEWAESGLRMGEFCDQRGVALHSLRYWNTRAEKTEDQNKAAPSFVVVSRDELRQASAPRDDRGDQDDAIEIVVGGAYFMRIPRRAATLSEILSAMREVEK